MVQEAEDHGQHDPPTLDGRAEAEHSAGGPAGWPDGQRGLPAAPDPAHAVLPLGEAGSCRGTLGAAGQRAGTPQAGRHLRPTGRDRAAALGGGGPDDREPRAEKGGLALGPHQRVDEAAKLRILEVVDTAQRQSGLSVAALLGALGLDRSRYYRWRARQRQGRLGDSVVTPKRSVPPPTPAEIR